MDEQKIQQANRDNDDDDDVVDVEAPKEEGEEEADNEEQQNDNPDITSIADKELPRLQIHKERYNKRTKKADDVMVEEQQFEQQGHQEDEGNMKKKKKQEARHERRRQRRLDGSNNRVEDELMQEQQESEEKEEEELFQAEEVGTNHTTSHEIRRAKRQQRLQELRLRNAVDANGPVTSTKTTTARVAATTTTSGTTIEGGERDPLEKDEMDLNDLGATDDNDGNNNSTDNYSIEEDEEERPGAHAINNNLGARPLARQYDSSMDIVDDFNSNSNSNGPQDGMQDGLVVVTTMEATVIDMDTIRRVAQDRAEQNVRQELLSNVVEAQDVHALPDNDGGYAATEQNQRQRQPTHRNWWICLALNITLVILVIVIAVVVAVVVDFGNKAPSQPEVSNNGNDNNNSTTMTDYTNRTDSDTILEGNATFCNATNTFRTVYAIAVVENVNLLTEEQLQLIADIFTYAYNKVQSETTDCDPFFRSITSVRATANVNFDGATEDLLENPIPIIPVRGRRERERVRRQLDFLHFNGVDDKKFKRKALHKADIQQPESLLRHGGSKHTARRGLPRDDTKFRELQDSTVIFTDDKGVTSERNATQLYLVKLEIFGTCHRCEDDNDLFDSVLDLSLRRNLQENYDGPDDAGCICPANAGLLVVDVTTFVNAFDNVLEEQSNAGELIFRNVVELFQVQDKPCPPVRQEFASVYLAPGVILPFGFMELLFSERVRIDQLTTLFRDRYNAVAQQLCDPKFRAISDVAFISIQNSIDPSTGQPIATFEFLVEGTCRDCSERQCLFDDDGCKSNRRQMERHNPGREGDPPSGRDANIKTEMGRGSLTLPLEKKYSAMVKDGGAVVKDAESGSNHETSPNEESSSSRKRTVPPQDQPAQDAPYTHSQNNRVLDEEEPQCACRRRRPIRAPTTVEFLQLFQDGLDELIFSFKGDSCEKCIFNLDCKSNVCLSGRCAEKDSGLLLNGCSCVAGGECQSGLCDSKKDNTCRSPLGSCTVCADHSGCHLGSSCVEGYCAGIGATLEIGCPCVENANCGTSRCDKFGTRLCQVQLPTCASCKQDADCMSGVCVEGLFCGVARLEGDVHYGGQLPEGCPCTLSTQCQTGRCARFFGFGETGLCSPMITDTCSEPCIFHADCVSGVCGSIACLPPDNALLENGCSSGLSIECQSGTSQGGICVDPTT